MLLADIQLTPEAKDLVAREPNVIFQHCDVRRWADLTAAIRASEQIWNDVPDVYVPNAGIFEPVMSLAWRMFTFY